MEKSWVEVSNKLLHILRILLSQCMQHAMLELESCHLIPFVNSSNSMLKYQGLLFSYITAKIERNFPFYSWDIVTY